jgi:TRAP-type uncharacterized transport system fused permease subunit
MLGENQKQEVPKSAADLGIHDPLMESFPNSAEGRLLFWIAVAFSAFQVATAAHLIDFPSQVVRAFHVGFLTLLIFPFVAMTMRKPAPVKIVAWILALAGVTVALYQWFEFTDLLLRAGDPTQLDIVIGVVALFTVFAAAWVIMGPALACAWSSPRRGRSTASGSRHGRRGRPGWENR